ncbi:MAG: aldo/keto reductase [Actinomycetota bacterium]
MSASSLVDASPRQLGTQEVGPLAYGLWRFTTSDLDEATTLIETALDCGMNLIDAADVYGLDYGGKGFGAVEELLGAVLARTPSLRERMVLATKGGITPPTPYDSSPPALIAAVEASLRRLGVDHIDLYQIHRPDLLAHPAEVAGTLLELQAQGKIGDLGVSNHTTAQTRALLAHLGAGGAGLVSTQPEFSAVTLDPMRDGTFDLCMELDLTPLAWSPLGGGRLASGDGVRPELLAVLDRLAEREGVDRATLAMAFVLANPSRPVAIVGSQRPERITGSLKALEVHLDRNDVYDVVEASEGVPLP